MKLMMFSKHLQDLEVPDAAEVIKSLGFEGVDLTVRGGGHVSPDRVRLDLPKAVQTIRDLGLEVPLITTNLSAADEPNSDAIFETAGELGIPNVKLGYSYYREFGTFNDLLRQFNHALDDIEALAERTGVRANLHNHSGHFMTAMAPIVHQLLKDRNPDALGFYIDPCHLVVEGGLGDWLMSLDLCAEQISLVAIKDFVWNTENNHDNKPEASMVWTPLSQGLVNWPKVFQCLHEIGYDGWLSVHMEYWTTPFYQMMSLDEKLAVTSEDMTYLRGVMKKASVPA